jgi:N-acetylmuramoyl-L-alanine amidase
MVKYLGLSIALLAAMSMDIAASVRTEYTHATEQEQAVRMALADPAATAAVLRNVRRAVAAYEGIVRRHPISSYSDDALWFGARLALDAFDRFGESHDRETALRLLRLLASQYPTSKRAKQVPELLAREHKQQPPAPARRSARVDARTGDASPPPAGTPIVAARPAPAEPAKNATANPATVETKVAASEPVRSAMPPAAAPVSAVTAPKMATISAIRRIVLPDVIRVTIALDAEVPYHEERIDGPSRIFVDFPSTRTAASLTDQTLRFEGDSDLVRHVRIGRHPNQTTRVVLDAAGISSYSVYPIYNPYRLVIDCLRASSSGKPVQLVAAAAPIPARPMRLKPEAAVKGVKPPVIELPPPIPPRLASHRVAPAFSLALPKSQPLATASLAAAYVPPLSTRAIMSAIATVPAAAPAAAGLIAAALIPTPPSIPSSPTVSPTAVGTATPPAAPSNLSMARQLGLGVSRIVIDPGHGGHDPGAKGKGGVTEAELVLDVSLRLQKLLEKVPGVEVILTRQVDCFIALQERTAIANREGADLFLSIHANASANEQAHGVETYFLNFANNLNAASVAARENAASGQAMAALPDFVKAITLNNKADESRDFAGIVQSALVDHLQETNKQVKNLGVKQAPFLVLIGASMPSVLTEVSFVTNPQEAKLLKNNAYRQKIAESLFEAIRRYQMSLTRTQSVAVH